MKTRTSIPFRRALRGLFAVSLLAGGVFALSVPALASKENPSASEDVSVGEDEVISYDENVTLRSLENDGEVSAVGLAASDSVTNGGLLDVTTLKAAKVVNNGTLTVKMRATVENVVNGSVAKLQLKGVASLGSLSGGGVIILEDGFDAREISAEEAEVTVTGSAAFENGTFGTLAALGSVNCCGDLTVKGELTVKGSVACVTLSVAEVVFEGENGIATGVLKGTGEEGSIDFTISDERLDAVIESGEKEVELVSFNSTKVEIVTIGGGQDEQEHNGHRFGVRLDPSGSVKLVVDPE